jgi:hypothetical protein
VQLAHFHHMSRGVSCVAIVRRQKSVCIGKSHELHF